MTKAESFDHNQHPNQESKQGLAPYASSMRINYSANDARVEQHVDQRVSLWQKLKKLFTAEREVKLTIHHHAEG